MEAIREYENVAVFYHAVSEWSFNQLLQEANGVVEDIVLYGRVFDADVPFLEAEAEGLYVEGKGEGYVYACSYEDRDCASPGASPTTGVTLMLGWNKVEDDRVRSDTGELLVPLSSYKVIGVMDAE